ncbi:hypothetical protein [Pedobacter frigiditerrae]|uniref:hypothetical protein n=1 Tax=Pedobacter frigiditerrae TaxID=2530452 RepID=UPI00292ED91E|nr:hypothetical protein [Pedobacter frigiditerrae]
MEQQAPMTPAQAFEIVYRLTGTLQLNRVDNQILDTALRTLALLIPKEETKVEAKK